MNSCEFGPFISQMAEDTKAKGSWHGPSDAFSNESSPPAEFHEASMPPRNGGALMRKIFERNRKKMLEEMERTGKPPELPKVW